MTKVEPSRVPAIAVAAYLVAMGFYLYGFAHRVAPSIMTDELMREFAVGAGILGNLSAFYFYAYAGLQIPVGVLMDRVGPRRLLTGAAATAGVGSALFGLAPTVEVAYAGRLLIGIGAAFTFVGVLTVIAQTFPARRFALLTGFAQMSGMAGAIAGGALLRPLVGAFGWREMMVAVAAVGGVLAIMLWLTVRDRGDVISPSAGRAASLTAGIRTVSRNRDTWLASTFGFAQGATVLAFAGLWSVPFLTVVHGLDRREAADLTALMFVGWGIGAPIVGAISDRVGRRGPMIVLAMVSGMLFAGILYIPDLPTWGLRVLYASYGATGCTMSLCFAAVRERNPAFATGAALGIANMSVMAGGAVFQPLIGLVLDLEWDGTTSAGVPVYDPADYRTALSALLGAAVVATLAAICLRPSVKGAA